MSDGKHTLQYCDHCQSHMVVCGRCGNNCCNGGTGKLADGSECGCDEAYAIQDDYFTALHPAAPST